MGLCPKCQENDCLAITPGLEQLNDGTILIVLDEITSAAVSNGSFFAGSEGNSLTKLLEDVGLKDTDVSVCAVSPCYKSDSRDRRTFSECLARRKYKQIICLGDRSLSFLCGRFALKDVRGTSLPLHKEFGLSDVHVFPSYPLSLLRRVPNYRRVVLSDLRSAVGQSKAPQDVEWDYWDGTKILG